ncbi:hypothetical protein BGZ80_006987 [Entomortierella chlamydospora]|uniref:Nadh-ubiquinone oxidoreductase kDa subunit n=1 Tax=Entomortierella chlamydospora TaxID=101097 RepID=A0A9P6MZZ3_9FUNG|nr:hypothetical protein BGZ80_006987 [Entomortierella chlamydospora]
MTAHLSVMTLQSSSLASARQSVIHLYCDFQRGIDLRISAIRTKIHEEFERHRDIKDLAAIDILFLKCRQEYQETMNAWKQKTHIMHSFIKDDALPSPGDPWRVFQLAGLEQIENEQTKPEIIRYH